jgi:hypothetical protein
MRGAIPPPPQYVFMAGYLVKHRDNFTFTFALPITDKYELVWRIGDPVGVNFPKRSLVIGRRLKLRPQKFVVGNSGRIQRKHASTLKPSVSVANCCSFLPSFEEKFSKMKFCDLALRLLCV